MIVFVKSKPTISFLVKSDNRWRSSTRRSAIIVIAKEREVRTLEVLG